LSIIDTAKSGPSSAEISRGKSSRTDDRSSLNLELLSQIITEDDSGLVRLLFDVRPGSSETVGRPRTRALTLSMKDHIRSSMAKRLHTLVAFTSGLRKLPERHDQERRHSARRYVYDWSSTNEHVDYGPYSHDGSGKVDWTLLEAAMTCISSNFAYVMSHLSPPQGLFYSIPHRTLTDPTLPEDWAGVCGFWLGTYSFLDYTGLVAFNAGLLDIGLSRQIDLRPQPEATGDLLRMQLKLDNSVINSPSLRSNVPICTDLPPLYFSGQSHGTDFPAHPLTEVKGFAALVAGGREVKWKFIIQYHGSEQWQLEGVQPGGVRSGGIFGGALTSRVASDLCYELSTWMRHTDF
jgi:hypothetical protein